MPEFKHEAVRSRNEAFVECISTRIWHEVPSSHNPYIPIAALCHGYDLCELMQKRSFVDVFYLLFRGELPTPDQAQLLEQLMIALINPGPRHPATRAAMSTGIGKTDPAHILPIALGVLGGHYRGAGQVEAAMRFLRKSAAGDPQELVQSLRDADHELSLDQRLNGELFMAVPGFGRFHGGRDLLTHQLAESLARLPGADRIMHWGKALASALEPLEAGWLPTGLAAAVFCDLGFQPRMGASLFQLLSAPGLAAQGLEVANKPITAMPFVKDEDYVIEQ